VSRETIEDATAHVRVAVDELQRQIERETDRDVTFCVLRALRGLSTARVDLALARLGCVLEEATT